MIYNRLSILIGIFSFALFLTSCEEDEGKLPEMEFKTGSNYTSVDSDVAAGSDVLFGITAQKAEEKDPLISFNVSKKVNDGTTETVYNYTLSETEEDAFEQDYTYTVVESAGDEVTLIFTITNRDGLQVQKSIILSIQ